MPQLHGLAGEVLPEKTTPTQGQGQVILAVDDEPEVLAALEEMLATLGYEPAGFRDSREALDAVRLEPARYEAVVSDEVMPGLTGTHTMGDSGLRSRKPDTRSLRISSMRRATAQALRRRDSRVVLATRGVT